MVWRLLQLNDKIIVASKAHRRNGKLSFGVPIEMPLECLTENMPGFEKMLEESNAMLAFLRKKEFEWTSPPGDRTIGQLMSNLSKMEGAKACLQRRLAALRDPKPWDCGNGGAWGTNNRPGKKVVTSFPRLLSAELGFAPSEGIRYFDGWSGKWIEPTKAHKTIVPVSKKPVVTDVKQQEKEDDWFVVKKGGKVEKIEKVEKIGKMEYIVKAPSMPLTVPLPIIVAKPLPKPGQQKSYADAVKCCAKEAKKTLPIKKSSTIVNKPTTPKPLPLKKNPRFFFFNKNWNAKRGTFGEALRQATLVPADKLFQKATKSASAFALKDIFDQPKFDVGFQSHKDSVADFHLAPVHKKNYAYDASLPKKSLPSATIENNASNIEPLTLPKKFVRPNYPKSFWRLRTFDIFGQAIADYRSKQDIKGNYSVAIWGYWSPMIRLPVLRVPTVKAAVSKSTSQCWIPFCRACKLLPCNIPLSTNLKGSPHSVENLRSVQIGGGPKPVNTNPHSQDSSEITQLLRNYLLGPVMLNDEVINRYMQLLMEYNSDRIELPSIHIFDTHFYNVLSAQGFDAVTNFLQSRRRWLNFNLFDLILVPIHIPEKTHWALAVIDMKSRRISYMDSLHNTDDNCLELLFNLVVHQNSHYTSNDPIVREEWTLENRLDIPEQHNGYDCGAFVCSYAYRLANLMDFNFSQDDLQNFRREMGQAISDNAITTVAATQRAPKHKLPRSPTPASPSIASPLIKKRTAFPFGGPLPVIKEDSPKGSEQMDVTTEQYHPIPKTNMCGFRRKCYLSSTGSLRDVHYCAFIQPCGCVYHRLCMRIWQQNNNPVQACPQHGQYVRSDVFVARWKHIRTGGQDDIVEDESTDHTSQQSDTTSQDSSQSIQSKRGRPRKKGRTDSYICVECGLKVDKHERSFSTCCFELFHNQCLLSWRNSMPNGPNDACPFCDCAYCHQQISEYAAITVAKCKRPNENKKHKDHKFHLKCLPEMLFEHPELADDECPACHDIIEPQANVRNQAEEEADDGVARQLAADQNVDFTEPIGPAPRRREPSQRIASRASQTSVDNKTGLPTYQPVTQRCKEVHKLVGCAAESAMHLPEYYNSLDPDGTGKRYYCDYCEAPLLRSEYIGHTGCSKCCAKGRVNLRGRFNVLQQRPIELQNLMENRQDAAAENRRDEFFKHIVQYNNHLSFGQVSVRRDEEYFPEFFRIVKINNMIEYVAWDFRSPHGEPALRGQLYTIPSDSAAHDRLNAIAANNELDVDILYLLHRMLSEINHFAAIYKTAAEVYEEETPERRQLFRLLLVNTDQRGNERSVPEPEINLSLDEQRKIRRDIHPGRLGVETAAGSNLVAQIYFDSGVNVIPGGTHHIVLHGQEGTGKRHIKWHDRNVDPIGFPLIFPYGEYGYEQGVALNLHPDESVNKKGHIVRADGQFIDPAIDLGEGEAILPANIQDPDYRIRNISRCQWIRFMLHHHGHNSTFSDPHFILDKRKLAQTYILCFNNKMEAQRVSFQKSLQGRRNYIRPNALIEWLEHIRAKEGKVGQIGRVYRTNEHVRGSRQYYQKNYADCMTINRDQGSPNLLITFTMDPDCPELKEMLGPGQQWFDRPDLVCRLFIDKLAEFRKDLTEREIMGKVKSWFSAVEHQKRGLPHVHFCLTLDWDQIRVPGSHIQTEEDYMREYISAEIPDLPDPKDFSREAQKLRELHRIVTMKMIHTCGKQRCLRDGKCTKRFPKPFEEDWIFQENGYPRYRRRDPRHGGNTYKMPRGQIINNSHVVSYNKYLLLKYKAHINVEYLSGEGCTKYVCYYVMKGADMALVRVDQLGRGMDVNAPDDPNQTWNFDEYHQMQMARYITSFEAFLSSYGHPIIEKSHIVDILDVHTPTGRRVMAEEALLMAAKDDEDEERAAAAQERLEEMALPAEERITQLTAYFAFNAENKDNPLGLTYVTAYKKIRYDIPEKKWKRYIASEREGQKLCRIRSVSPSDLELLAIRLLLFVVIDPTCWADLRTYKGVVYDTFVEAARARQLMEDNSLWIRTIQEVFDATTTIAKRIRWLAVFFATANLQNPMEVFETLLKLPQDWMVGTSVAGKSLVHRRQYVLRNLEWFLRQQGVQTDYLMRDDGTFESACERIGLPRPEDYYMDRELHVNLQFNMDEIVNINIDPELVDNQNMQPSQMRYMNMYKADPQPSDEQRQFIFEIMDAVNSSFEMISGDGFVQPNIQRCFFVSGEGGCGKTFLFNRLIALAKAQPRNILVMASTGIAAELLHEGATVHKTLIHRRHVDASSNIEIDRESTEAEVIRRTHAIIIDEISMQDRDVLEYVDRLFREMANTQHEKSMPFAGKTVILGGDWKQLMPVVPAGGNIDQYLASVKNSDLFGLFATRRLTHNLRLESGQQQYRDFIMGVGTGKLNDYDSRVQLPEGMVVRTRVELLEFVFPQYMMDEPLKYGEELGGRAILCPRNLETFQFTQIILDRMKGDVYEFEGITTPITSVADRLASTISDADMENLRRFTPSGVPEHILKMKKGSIMILTTNISVRNGLCNGTRLQIEEFHDEYIRCKILSGSAKGEYFNCFRIRFAFGADPNAPNEGTIRCNRIQFPLRPGMAMTINRSQGQTLTRVGMALDRSQCFSHGQLYTGISRVRAAENIRICTDRADRRVKNIVIEEILDKEDARYVVPPFDPDNMFPRQPPTTFGDTSGDVGPSSSETPKFPPRTSTTTPSLTTPSISTRFNFKYKLTARSLDPIDVVRNDITRVRADMIVNAANPNLETIPGGPGIDVAIQNACRPEGDQLADALNDYRAVELTAGNVVITETFGQLKNTAQKIAHAIVPIITGITVTNEQRAALRNCYRNALTAMRNNELHSIAIPCIGTGQHNFPIDQATRIAFEAIADWLAENIDYHVEEIKLVGYHEREKKLLQTYLNAALLQIAPPRSRPTPKIVQTPSSSHILRPGPSTLQTTPIRTTGIRQPTARANVPPVQVIDAGGGGDCLQRSIIHALLGRTDENAVAILREVMYGLLLQIAENDNIYPRNNPNFDGREEFMQHITLAILGAPEGADRGALEHFESLHFYGLHMQPLARNDITRWGQVNDLILASMLLRRPIVIVQPSAANQDPVQFALTLHRWDDPTFQREMHIYFPDGSMRTVPRDVVNADPAALSNFTIPALLPDQYNYRQEYIPAQEVQNPVVIWYNGVDHFQPFHFSARTNAERLSGFEFINQNADIPEQLWEPEPIQMAEEQPIIAIPEQLLEPEPIQEAEKQPLPEIPLYNFSFRPNVELEDFHRNSGELGDITRREVDAIVNPTNTQLLRDLGVSDAIHAACEPQQARLESALLQQLLLHDNLLQDGNVVITNTFGNLSDRGVQFILHVVGPRVENGVPTQENRQALAQCYINALDRAADLSLHSIVFPSISTGQYGYPTEEAAAIALETTINWLSDHRGSTTIESIDFVVDIPEVHRVYQAVFRMALDQINAILDSRQTTGTQRVEEEPKQQPAEPIETAEISPNIYRLGPAVDNVIVGKIWLIDSDITMVNADAIVNAANNRLIKGGGVDNAIHTACATDNNLLEADLAQYIATHGELPTGQVVRTPAYGRLASHVQHIIHTVGPRVERKQPTSQNRQALRDCYNNVLDEAVKNGIRSIAFPSISTGAFGYPEEEAAKIALETILNWLANHPGLINEVKIVLPKNKDIGKIYRAQLLAARMQVRSMHPPTPSTVEEEGAEEMRQLNTSRPSALKSTSSSSQAPLREDQPLWGQSSSYTGTTVSDEPRTSRSLSSTSSIPSDLGEAFTEKVALSPRLSPVLERGETPLPTSPPTAQIQRPKPKPSIKKEESKAADDDEVFFIPVSTSTATSPSSQRQSSDLLPPDMIEIAKEILADLFTRINDAETQLFWLEGYGSSKDRKMCSLQIEQRKQTREAVTCAMDQHNTMERVRLPTTTPQNRQFTTSEDRKFDQYREGLRKKFEGKIRKEEQKKIDIGIEYLLIHLRLRRLGQQIKKADSSKEITNYERRMDLLKKDLAMIEVDLPKTMATADENIQLLRDQYQGEVSSIEAAETRSAGKLLKSTFKIAKSVWSRKVGTAASDLLRSQPSSSHQQSAVGDVMRDEIAQLIAEGKKARRRAAVKFARRQEELHALEEDLHHQISRARIFTEFDMKRHGCDSLQTVFQQRVFNILDPPASDEPDVRKLKMEIRGRLMQKWSEEIGALTQAQKKEEEEIEQRRKFLRKQHNKILTSSKVAKKMSKACFEALMEEEQRHRDMAEKARLEVLAARKKAKFFKELMELQANRNFISEENKKRYEEALAKIENESLNEEQCRALAEHVMINARNELESELAGHYDSPHEYNTDDELTDMFSADHGRSAEAIKEWRKTEQVKFDTFLKCEAAIWQHCNGNIDNYRADLAEYCRLKNNGEGISVADFYNRERSKRFDFEAAGIVPRTEQREIPELVNLRGAMVADAVAADARAGRQILQAQRPSQRQQQAAQASQQQQVPAQPVPQTTAQKISIRPPPQPNARLSQQQQMPARTAPRSSAWNIPVWTRPALPPAVQQPIEEEMPQEPQQEQRENVQRETLGEEVMMEFEDCCGGDGDLNRALDESRAAPPPSTPAQNLHWMPRQIAGPQFVRLNPDAECAICKFPIDEGAIYAPCNANIPHLCHSRCLTRWLQDKNTCPVCRGRMDYTTAPSWWNEQVTTGPSTSAAAQSKQQDEPMDTGEEKEIHPEDVFMMRTFQLFRHLVLENNNDPETAARVLLLDIEKMLAGEKHLDYGPPRPNDFTDPRIDIRYLGSIRDEITKMGVDYKKMKEEENEKEKKDGEGK